LGDVGGGRDHWGWEKTFKKQGTWANKVVRRGMSSFQSCARGVLFCGQKSSGGGVGAFPRGERPFWVLRPTSGQRSARPVPEGKAMCPLYARNVKRQEGAQRKRSARKLYQRAAIPIAKKHLLGKGVESIRSINQERTKETEKLTWLESAGRHAAAGVRSHVPSVKQQVDKSKKKELTGQLVLKCFCQNGPIQTPPREKLS